MTGPRFLRRRAAPPGGQPSDGDVVPTEAFQHIMLPHLDAAYSYARYLTRDADRAEDVTQEAFLRAFRHFETWRGDSARGWLLQIVRNCFIATVGERPHEDPAAEEPIDLRDPETIAVEQDEAAQLRQTIADLPQPFRETLILREFEELSYKEIADLTQVPIGTVMSRLARARTLLAQLLLPGGAVEAGVRP